MVLYPDQENRLKADEIEIANHYAGASLTEVMSVKGRYLLSPRIPFTPGYEFLGTVVRIGSGTKKFSLGDLVCGIVPHGGGYSSQVIIKEKFAVLAGSMEKSIQVSASIINYLTALELLSPLVKRGIGGNVLIRGVAGGVGLAVLELGKIHNIRVYGTCSMQKKVTVESRGGIWLDRNVSLQQQASKFPAKGFDVVMDAFGVVSFRDSIKFLKRGGTFCAYGFFGDLPPFMDAIIGVGYLLVRCLASFRKLHIVSVPAMVELSTKKYRKNLQEIVSYIQNSTIEIGPIEVFPISQVFEAHRKIEASEVVGKVVLDCRNQHSNI